MNTKLTFLLTGLVLGGATMVGISAMADGDPTTDNVPQMIPYQGMLEIDGQPVNATGADAIWLEFALFDGPDAEAPVYIQRRALEVYVGRFTTTIGPEGENGAAIIDVIRAADDLYLGMTLLGNLDEPADDIALAGRQRIMATPYAMWSTSATNMSVARDLIVGGSANINGAVNVGGTLAVGDSIIPSVGGAGKGIQFPANPGGGDGDDAWIRYTSEGDDNTKLQIGINNDADDVLEFYQATAPRMSISGGNVTVANNLTVNGSLTTSSWPTGQYCIFRNGNTCPSGFGNETVILDIGTHGHAICPNPSGDSSPDSAGDTTMIDINGAGRCQINFRMCCK